MEIIDLCNSCNSFQDTDSYSKTLVLLQYLSNLDPIQISYGETTATPKHHSKSFHNVLTNCEKESAEEVREYFELSSTFGSSACSIATTQESSIAKEQSHEKSQCPVSPTFSRSSVVSIERSHLSPTQQSDQSGLATKHGHQLDPTRDSVASQESLNDTTHKNRRKKISSTWDEDAEQSAQELDIWGPPEGREIINSGIIQEEQPSNGYSSSRNNYDKPSESKSSRLHSAAALFRRPSAASKKYTRAPMSKLFISLDITAEMFLELQGAAKIYMLDKNFPERLEAIGNKRRTENDFNKLKLFSIVKHFLEEEGWGERCFGSKVEEANQRKLRWPESKNLIIKRVTPLMRRMVTNERQRQYANETRMEKRLGKLQKRVNSTKSLCTVKDSKNSEINSCSSNLSINRTIDSPLLLQITSELDLNSQSNSPQNYKVSMDNALREQLPISVRKYMKYYINFLQEGVRVKERLLVKCDEYLKFSDLIHHMTLSIDHLQEKVSNINVHGPDGLIKVYNEKSWAQAVWLIFKHEWMDQEIRCLVNLAR